MDVVDLVVGLAEWRIRFMEAIDRVSGGYLVVFTNASKDTYDRVASACYGSLV